MLNHLSVATLLLLAACGGGGDEAGNNSAGEGEAAGGVVEQAPSNLQDDPNNSVVPLSPPPANAAAPTATAAPVTALPAGFRGRWGMGDKDCDPKFDYVAKGLMVVAADSLKFYESRGRIERAEATRPDTLTLDLGFTGEGQEWNRRETLTLLDGGRTLVREEQKPAGSFRYTRCPTTTETPVDQRGA